MGDPTVTKCGKVGYSGHGEASRVVSAAKKFGNRAHPCSKIPQRVYRCPECGMWHITSKKKKKGRRKNWN